MKINWKLLHTLLSIGLFLTACYIALFSWLMFDFDNDFKEIDDKVIIKVASSSLSIIPSALYESDTLSDKFISLYTGSVFSFSSVMFDMYPGAISINLNRFRGNFKKSYKILIDLKRAKDLYSISELHNGNSIFYDYYGLSKQNKKFIPMKTRIPNNILYTAKSPDKKLGMECKKVNSMYSLFTYSDDQALKFVRDNMPDYVYKAYVNLPLPVLKADLFRYIVAFTLGGFYNDADIDCFNPFSSIVDDNIDFVVGVEKNLIDVDNWLGWNFPRKYQLLQWTFGSAPGHPILADIIDKIVAMEPRITASIGYMDKLARNLCIVEFSGPGVFTDSVLNYIAKKKAQDPFKYIYINSDYGFSDDEFYPELEKLKLLYLLRSKLILQMDTVHVSSIDNDIVQIPAIMADMSDHRFITEVGDKLKDGKLDTGYLDSLYSSLRSRLKQRSMDICFLSTITYGIVEQNIFKKLLKASAEPGSNMYRNLGLSKSDIEQNMGITIEGVKILPRIFFSPGVHGPDEEKNDPRAIVSHRHMSSWKDGI